MKLPVYLGFNKEKIHPNGWEVVYFLNPYCSGTCTHCWSYNKFLGYYLPIDWHINFWMKVDFNKLREIRLTGGEPLEYKGLSEIVKVLTYKNFERSIPIYIFTSGRGVVSFKKGKEGIKETIENLVSLGIVKENVEIHLSCDEHHAGSLYRYVNHVRKSPSTREEIELHNMLGISLMIDMVKNFLAACEILREKNFKFRGGKLKIHCEMGRGEFHKNIYGFLSKEEWEKHVIITEGLFNSGKAIFLGNNIEVPPDKYPPLFIIPGAEFSLSNSNEKNWEEYRIMENGKIIGKVYLVGRYQNSKGASIIGFHNLIYNIFCGGSAEDALMFIG